MQLSTILAMMLVGLAAAIPLSDKDLSARGLPGSPNTPAGSTPPDVSRRLPQGGLNVPNPHGARGPGNPGLWLNPPQGARLHGNGPEPGNIRFDRPPQYVQMRPGMGQPPHVRDGPGRQDMGQPPHVRGGGRQ
ncbi:hypothetical protein XA68_10879 [Ophiocordyceps unilateralis]|uniref:Uncharacterized protein n=1 Tax=Ophiocordyceps unilateralis TaxID=268505 RepID=A0A2A9PGH6_OPHUN|nr:hypothetical protein XA68_10879 [Ophiocordyceps unilateralis]